MTKIKMNDENSFLKKLPQSGILKNQIKPNKTNKNMFYFVLEDLIINQIVFYLVFERREA